jgi:hypothetical protein
MNPASADVKVTTGDIYFDGRLREEGTYSFQSMKGDIDMNLPAAMSFNLFARSLSERISLGDFMSNLTAITRGAKSIKGTHRNGGPNLTVTAYDGHILFHKK